MILVDTSVLVGFLRGHNDTKVQLFGELLARNIPFGISAYTYQEVLQGAHDEAEFQTLRDYLSTQPIYYLEQDAATYERAAMLYFSLRRRGVTPRSTIDILIAITAMDNDLALLHNDRDFDAMAGHVPELRIASSLS